LALGRLEILTVNATVIIGLLVLLTFQSISSSFIENESSDFIIKWNAAQTELNAIDYFLSTDCKMLSDDRESYEKFFVEQHIFTYDDGSEFPLFDHLSKEMEKELKNYCNKLVIDGMEKNLQLEALDELGYGQFYLDQYDPEEEIVYTYEYYDFDPELMTIESDYFYDIATGPLWVNLTNLVMLFPFLVSAMITSFNMVRKKGESERASMAAILSMAIGFGMMIVGLMIIVGGFVTIYKPFI